MMVGYLCPRQTSSLHRRQGEQRALPARVFTSQKL